jgi:hypothetical protein
MPEGEAAGEHPRRARLLALVAALRQGHRWVLTGEETAAVKGVEEAAVAMEPAALTEVQDWSGEVGVAVSTDGNGVVHGVVEGEAYEGMAALEEKLKLYPAGTRGRLVGWDERDAGWRAVRALVVARGWRVE